MSTTPRAAASDSLIALIQPYVDDDLPPDERARVDAVLAEDPVLRDMVEEQCSVRRALQALPRASAPQALQARVLLELDAIDRELAAASALAGAAAPRWPRLRWFLRGAAVMVPAGATALAMFLLVRTQGEPAIVASPAPAEFQLAQLEQTPLLLGSSSQPTPGVRLVGARLVGPLVGPPLVGPPLVGPPLVGPPLVGPPLIGPPLGSRFGTGLMPDQAPRMVELRVGARRILDRREPAGGPPPGPAHDHQGQRFWLGTVDGQPAVSFETEGLRHTLTRLGPGYADEQEYMFLLSLGHAMR